MTPSPYPPPGFRGQKSFFSFSKKFYMSIDRGLCTDLNGIKLVQDDETFLIIS